MTNKILGYIGLAIRGKYILLGEDSLKKIKKGNIIILANDASESLKEKVISKASLADVSVVSLFDKNTLGQLLNKNQVAILIVTNHSLATQIKKAVN